MSSGDFKRFLGFFIRAWPTNLRTSGRTDGRTECLTEVRWRPRKADNNVCLFFHQTTKKKIRLMITSFWKNLEKAEILMTLFYVVFLQDLFYHRSRLVHIFDHDPWIGKWKGVNCTRKKSAFQKKLSCRRGTQSCNETLNDARFKKPANLPQLTLYSGWCRH